MLIKTETFFLFLLAIQKYLCQFTAYSILLNWETGKTPMQINITIIKEKFEDS